MPPRVHVLSDDTEFDPVFLKHLRQEGFNVNYMPYTGTAKEFKWSLQHLADELELGQSYAMVGKLTLSYVEFILPYQIQYISLCSASFHNYETVF